MKKVMPLWFVDIIGTEEKISKLALEGKRLISFSPLLGTAEFTDAESENALYRICYQKNCGGVPPKGIAANGWESVCGSKNIYIVKNTDTASENVPSYKFWKSVNRIIMMILVFVICFFSGTLLGIGFKLIEEGSFSQNGIKMLITSLSCFAVIAALLAYLAHVRKKFEKTDMDLNLKGVIRTIPEENFIYTPEQEKEMLKNKTMIKKSPLGWFYAPDTAEKMVGEMAEKGWKFYRFNKLGTVFYFVKSEPVKLKFVVDYQTEASDEYFSQSKDDGWKLEYTSMVRATSFIIWSKEYTEEEPEFYSDPTTMLKRAKRMALQIGIPFILLIALFIFILISLISSEEETVSLVSLIAMYSVIIIEYAVFAFKTIGFYFRTKKKYDI